MDWLSEDDELFPDVLEEEEVPELDEPVADLEFLEEAPPELRQRVGDERLSAPNLSHFDKAALIGARAKQISLRAPIQIPLELRVDSKGKPIIDPGEIARLELKHGVFPLKIIRIFADGTYEEWSVDELFDPEKAFE